MLVRVVLEPWAKPSGLENVLRKNLSEVYDRSFGIQPVNPRKGVVSFRSLDIVDPSQLRKIDEIADFEIFYDERIEDAEGGEVE
ncbi:hypothetical protein [Palleronia caenipelagi]|uniref:hypothetical protein n=1 Tax=Palleronia caenipelagi TaxID=2489174 RepID=UPI001C8F3349|nr:hypothetical protein [Palleronia caenipelagi]